MKITIKKIISGGQTGVDRASLDVAVNNNIQCGGHCPKGRKAEDGVIPEHYPLIETSSDDYKERTSLNIMNSDGTLIIIDKTRDKGTQTTIDLLREHHKPLIICDLSVIVNPKQIRSWIFRNKIRTLNIAGPRESNCPGIYKQSYDFIQTIMIDK